VSLDALSAALSVTGLLDVLPPTLSVPEAGRLCGLGRDASYAAASRGEIPTLRFGRRVVVPTYRLLELLGAPAPIPGTAVAPDE
jgi:hypothetical protein